MTVDELLEMVQGMVDQGYGDREVLFVYQENYPLQDHIAGCWESPEDESVVYLVSGGQDTYGPRAAFSEVTSKL